MHPKMFADLHERMAEFIYSWIDNEHFPEYYFEDYLDLKMAKAAELVFDAAFDASEIAQQEIKKANDDDKNAMSNK